MLKILLSVAILVSAVPLFSQTTLSGKIGNMTIDSSGSPYIISDNTTVLPGKTLTIGEGVVLLFKPFTGLIVEGSLVVGGQVEKPVIFTTENDARYNPEAKQSPNPFDWNGILITQKAGLVKLSNFILEYSVYGVKSQKDEIVISNGVFIYNGQYHVTIKDAIKNVVDNIPFNFNKEPAPDTGSNGQVGLHAQNIPDSAAPRRRKPGGIMLRVAGLAAAGAGGYFFYLSNRYDFKYHSATSQGEADEFDEERNTALTTGTACAIGGGLSVIGGIILFTRHHAKAKVVTVAPILGKYNGISVAFNVTRIE